MNERGISEWAKINRSDALTGLDPRDWRGSKDKVVYNDPAGWAQACHQATVGLDVRTDDDRVACVFLMIENLNGKRRVPDPDGGLIISLLKAIQEQINMISFDHFRRARLQELHDYHEAICAGLTGQFAKAAEYQQLAIGRATNSWGQIIATYLASRENLNHCLANGLALESAVASFEIMVGLISRLANDQPDDSEKMRWHITVWYNYQIYRLLIQNIVPGDHSKIPWFLDLPDALAVPDDLKATFAGTDQCYRTLSDLANLDYQQAADIVAEDIPDIQDPEWVALALLIRVHAFHQAGKPDGAKEPLEQLRAMTWGCHLAQAIARQLGYLK